MYIRCYVEENNKEFYYCQHIKNSSLDIWWTDSSPAAPLIANGGLISHSRPKIPSTYAQLIESHRFENDAPRLAILVDR